MQNQPFGSSGKAVIKDESLEGSEIIEEIIEIDESGDEDDQHFRDDDDGDGSFIVGG